MFNELVGVVLSVAGFSAELAAVSPVVCDCVEVAVSAGLGAAGLGAGRVPRRLLRVLVRRGGVVLAVVAGFVSVAGFSAGVSGEGVGLATSAVSVAGRGIVAPTDVNRFGPPFSLVVSSAVEASATGMPPLNFSKVPVKRMW